MELRGGREINQKGINKDIAMKILSNLRIKDLVRFKCVSKHWDHIISDPIFAKLYIRPKSNMLLFFNLPTRKARVSCLSSDYYFHLFKTMTLKDRQFPLPCLIGPNAKVLGYVDGLICMSGEFGEILLYNPSTRHCRRLDLPDESSKIRSSVNADTNKLEIVDQKQFHDEGSSRRVRRAHPSKRSSVCESVNRLQIIDKNEYEICSKRARPSKKSNDDGDIEIDDKKKLHDGQSSRSGRQQRYFLGGIGYDECTRDYKVVCILFENNTSTKNNKVMVFPLRENSWREVTGEFPYSPGSNDTHRIPVNGGIHWFVRDRNCVRVIISFDLATEEIEEIPVPDHGDYRQVAADPYCRADLGALEGRLAIILHNQYSTERRFYIDVWLMEEYGVGSSWKRVELSGVNHWRDEEVILERQISCWNAPMFLCNNGQVWLGDAVKGWCHSNLKQEPHHRDFTATPMGFRNTMVAFDPSPASPFGHI